MIFSSDYLYDGQNCRRKEAEDARFAYKQKEYEEAIG